MVAHLVLVRLKELIFSLNFWCAAVFCLICMCWILEVTLVAHNLEIKLRAIISHEFLINLGEVSEAVGVYI